MFLNPRPPPVILYYCIKSLRSVKEEAKEKKVSHLQDALQLLNEADLLRYRVGKCGLGKR